MMSDAKQSDTSPVESEKISTASNPTTEIASESPKAPEDDGSTQVDIPEEKIEATVTDAPASTSPSEKEVSSPSPTEPKPAQSTTSAARPAPVAPTAPTPSKRRPLPPTKGILKPPPPPAKPSLGNRLRDIVTSVGGGAKSLFEAPPLEGSTSGSQSGPNAAGPSTSRQPSTSSISTPPPDSSSGSGTASGSGAVGGAFNSFSGRLSLGFSRLVAGASPSPSASPAASATASNDVTPTGSPLPSRSLSLPERGAGAASLEKGKRKDLKRATFLLPSLSITYPISSQGEPWSEKVLEERTKIESTHRSLLHTTTGAEYWTSQRLVALYENACKGREERPRVGIVRALEVIPKPPKPRTIHIILRPFDPTLPPLPSPAPYTLETPLNRHAAEAFADVLTTECGLTELRLESGALDGDDALKAILHALLVSGTLPTLSLAGNKKIRAGGWRLLAMFLKRARSLRYLDLSDTNWDRKSIDYLVSALNAPRLPRSASLAHDPAPPPGTPLKASKLLGVRSVRAHSEPGPAHTPPEQDKDRESSAVSDGSDAEEKSALAVPAKEEQCSRADSREDLSVSSVYGSFIPPAPLLKATADGEEEAAALQTLRMDGCQFRGNVLEALAQGVRSSDLRNISLRRNKIGPLGAVALALMMRDYPESAISMSTLSPGLSASLSSTSLASIDQQLSPSPSPLPQSRYSNRKPQSSPLKHDTALPSTPTAPLSPLPTSVGMSSRTSTDGYKPPPPPRHTTLPMMSPGGNVSADQGGLGLNTAHVEGRLSQSELGGASMALQRSVRALDGVERIGRLTTLDLKGNDIRTGVGYIAQVLKRNRTLKVLSLGDNRIDPAGLVSLAEALKYNYTLETLDMSGNPCCGPSQEGITALRSAFTLNTSLKRLFLSDTGLTTEGAITLAEFLPESKSLLHLDLTANPLIEAGGIMAISVGLRSNSLIRCLDLSIPPNQPELAELSQNILQSCIRNTELAVSSAAKAGEGHGQGRTEMIWGPIKKSTLVKDVKRADEVRAETERLQQAISPEGLAREYVYHLKPEEIVPVCKDTARDLEKWFEAGKIARKNGYQSPGKVHEHAWEPGQLPEEDYGPSLERGKALRERLIELIEKASTEPDPADGKLEELLSLNDTLGTLLERSKGFTPPPRLLLPSQVVPTPSSQPPPPTPGTAGTGPSSTLSPPSSGYVSRSSSFPRRHMRISSLEISSPNFSIGDSDNDSDAEELDVGALDASTSKTAKNSSMSSLSTATNRGNRAASLSRPRPLDSLQIPSIDTKAMAGPPAGAPGPSIPGKDVTHPTAGGVAGTSVASEMPGVGAEVGIEASSPKDEAITSPVESRGKLWMEEEGEIFRKGMKLGVGAEDDDEAEENEVSGEMLKQEILDTPVARSPTRRVMSVEESEGVDDDNDITEDSRGLEGED